MEENELEVMKTDVAALKNRMMSLAETENKLISELDRCAKYIKRVEDIIMEAAELRDKLLWDTKVYQDKVMSDIQEIMSTDGMEMIKKRIIDRLSEL